MSKIQRLPLYLVIVLLSFALLSSVAPLRAQGEATVLSVAVPEYLANSFPDGAFQQFEADHPGVKVNLIKLGQDMYFPPAAYEPDKYFDGAAAYAGRADVLYTSSYNLGTEGTRAGYFLDLSPLVKGDSSLNTDDFQPAAWQSFQWDGGIWAMPISLDVIIVSYDPAAFDKAGIAYPSGKWTVEDLADAARKLAIKGADGKVTTPGILAFNPGPLFRSLTGEGFYDDSTGMAVPKFDKPGLLHVLEVWAKLQSEDITGNSFRGDFSTVPLRIEQSFSIAMNMGNGDKPRSGALLPGDKAGLSVDGFAISSGTQHPELAYALTKFITGDPKLAGRFYGLMPARKSAAATAQADDSTAFRPKFTPENQAVLDAALANALPTSEYRFSEYVSQAMGDINDKKLDAKAALQAAEAKAVAVLQTATSKRGTKVVSVATPIPTPVLAQGEVSLKFNLVAYISPLPNRDRWDAVIKEFTSSDPQVKQLVLDTGFGSGGPNDVIDKYDCFALPYNFISDSNQGKLLNLDPLINADSSFDKSDIIGDTLTQLQRNNRTLGVPLYIQPEALRYNSELFAKANITLPENGWQIDTFSAALQALKVEPKDPAPFASHGYGGSYLQLLMAAYGGLPLDYRTTPLTINFTDPATVDAMRQTLDLAKRGYFDYKKLTSNGGGMMGGPDTVPIYTTSLSMLNFQSGSGNDTAKDVYRTIGYPRGTKFAPLSYTIGAAYISAQTAYPEACYRWISTLSKHPELFWAMPARRSQIDNPGVTAQGPDVAAFYKSFDKALQDPNAVIISPQAGSPGDYIISYFLFRVFDRYVLENADLESELKQAEMDVKSYQGCTANIPPSTATTMKETQDYFKQFTDCAIKVDPSLKSVFGQE